MKIVVVVGTRPNLIKFAALYKKLQEAFELCVIDTVQHYAAELSKQLREEFRLPKPDYELKVGSGSHAQQTARMLVGIEAVLVKEKPNAVVVFGDTNSALAGALAAAKIPIPVAHIEAGVRNQSTYLPEEVNRRVIDHVSSILFCPTPLAVKNLREEGVINHVYFVGDVLEELLQEAQATTQVGNSFAIPSPYSLLTIHREENTDDPSSLRAIFAGVGRLPVRVVFPMHPRTEGVVKRCNLAIPQNVNLYRPVGYRHMIKLQRNAVCILTDSGGIQREAYYLGRPCLVLRQSTEWPETLAGGTIRLVGTDAVSIAKGFLEVVRLKPKVPRLKKNVAGHITRLLSTFVKENA